MKVKICSVAFLVSLFVLGYSAVCHAQYNSPRNYVWPMLPYSSLDFNGSSMVTDTSGIGVGWSTAAVCDTFGRLLFYSDGKYVFNRKHTLMPKGLLVKGGGTHSTQPAAIVPFPADTSKYYLFIQDEAHVPKPLQYYVIDMTKDTGYGDIVDSAEIFSADSLSQKMITVTGNHHNIWVLVHKSDSPVFLAFNVTNAGVDTIPVRSLSGTFNQWDAYDYGVMKVSPNRRKLVLQCWGQLSGDTLGTELYDFDPETGKVSNCVLLDTFANGYGAEFSPDNSKLYCEYQFAYNVDSFYQFDLSLPTLSAIRASKTPLGKGATPRQDLRLTPDGRIFSRGNPPPGSNMTIDVISNPNLPAASCGYMQNAIVLPPNRGVAPMFPNVVWGTDTIAIPPTFTSSSATQKLLAVYPNPANQTLRIEAKEPIGTLTVFDAIGRELISLNSKSHSTEIDVRKLSPGNYWLRVEGAAVRQFVKQ